VAILLFTKAGDKMSRKPKIHYSQLPAIPIKLSESEVQAQIVQYLMDNDYLTIRVNSFASKVAGRYVRAYYVHGLNTAKGFPDLLAIKDGRCLLLEIKTSTGKPSSEQLEFSEYAKRRGVVVLTIRSVDDLQTYFKEFEL